MALRLSLVGAVMAGAVTLGACQTTQEQSALLEAQGAKAIKQQEGVDVDKEFDGVKVVGTTVLSDPDGSAVVVEIQNLTNQGLAKLPIAIDVLDAKGKSVFKNNDPGLDPALNTVPLIGPGETLDWVHDQVLAPEASSVKVKIGPPAEEFPAVPPEVTVTPPELEQDVTGPYASGKADTEGVVQLDLTLFGVARKGDEVVAAGRAGIKRLPPPSGRAQDYTIYFKGNPEGAEVEVTAPPSVLE